MFNNFLLLFKVCLFHKFRYLGFILSHLHISYLVLSSMFVEFLGSSNIPLEQSENSSRGGLRQSSLLVVIKRVLSILVGRR